MLERLDVFFNPEANQDAAFNINQALIAISAGVMEGAGRTAARINRTSWWRASARTSSSASSPKN